MKKVRRLWIVVALACAALLGYVVWKNHRVDLAEFIRDSSDQKYNVLLITIDTLRADHLGCYGFKEISTPNIDALAASGIQFTDATAHVPLTLPSHSSILTGNFPPYHGIHDNGGFYLPKSQITAAELFRKNGFATAAFVAAYVLDSSWGLDKGFDTYFDNFDLSKEERIGLSTIERKADDVFDHAVHWLDQHRNERFFLWTHFYDPHSPYEPPKEWAEKYPQRPYIGEIAYTDSVVGRLLAHLDQLGLREKTVIVLTGDHGESIGEHRESTHAFFVYDATLHVPLILSSPQKELQKKVVLNQVRSVDILPTLLQLAGVSVPESVQGRSLLHTILDTDKKLEALASYAECYYPQYHFGWSRLLSLRTGLFKYIDAPKPELYDLKKDPKELHNVIQEHRDIALRMKQELEAIDRARSQAASLQPGSIDAETHEKLAALGYVGAFSGPVDADPSKLPDPKDKIDLFNLIASARTDSLSGKSGDSIAKFKRALEADPGIVDAHFMLGNEYSRLERYPEALDEFKKTLELKPDYDFAIINLANTYRKMGRIDEALAGFELFLKKNPEKTQVLYRIGELYLNKDEPDKAMEYFQRALNVEPDTSWVYNSIGVAYLKTKQSQKAEESFRKALELNPKVAMAHFNLAQLYESQGKTEEAERQYLSELEISSKNFKADFNLGRMYLSKGKITEGIAHLKSSIENAPDFPLGYLFLAQALVENGSDLDQAAELANKGLSLDPDPEYRPLGHLVLADIYNRQGRRDLEQEQLRLAKER